MNRSGGSVGLIISLVGMFTIGGCASAPPRHPTPVQVIDLEPRVSLRPYTALAVKDFQNAVGDALPREALTKLPEAVVAHLKECYPKAFTRVERVASGSAAELVAAGTISGYEVGTRLRQLVVGGPPDRLIGAVTLADGNTGRMLTEMKVDLIFGRPNSGLLSALELAATAVGAVAGAAVEGGALVEAAGIEIAIALADKKGLFILRRQEFTERRFAERGSVPQGGMKAEQCYR